MPLSSQGYVDLNWIGKPRCCPIQTDSKPNSSARRALAARSSPSRCHRKAPNFIFHLPDFLCAPRGLASDKPPRYKSRHARRAAIAPLTTATPTRPNSRGVSNAAAERTKRRLIFREEREQLLDQIVGTLLNDPNGRSARSRRRAAVPQFQRFRARHQPYDLPPLLSVFAAINRVWVIAMRLSG